METKIKYFDENLKEVSPENAYFAVQISFDEEDRIKETLWYFSEKFEET